MSTTPSSPLTALPAEARLWAHGASRPLTADEERELETCLRTFFSGWTSHGRAVQAAYELREDRFLLVGALVPQGEVSGCGIDKLMRRLTALAQEMGFAWLSPLHVFYRDAQGAPQHASRAAFRDLAAGGAVTPETPVFDLGLTHVQALRRGAFEQPAARTWHARAFPALQGAA